MRNKCSVFLSMANILFFSSAFSMLFAYLIPINSIMVSFNAVLWVSFYNDYIAFASLLLFMGGLLCTKNTLYITPVSCFLLIVSSIPLFQWIFGIVFFSGDALMAFSYVAGAALAVFCATNSAFLGGRQQVLTLFSIGFVVLGLLSFYMTLYQFLRLDYAEGLIYGSSAGVRVMGNLRQSNNFSSLLIMCFLCSGYLYERKLYSRKIWLLLSCCMVSAIVLVQSRTAVLFLVLLILFFCFFCKKIRFRMTVLDLFTIVFLYVLWEMFFGFLEGALFPQGAVNSLKDVYMFADNARMLIWREALTAIINGPFWGYGWGQVAVAQVLVDSDLSRVVHFRQSHNLFLDLMLWNGPFLGACLIFSILFFGWRCLCRCRSVEDWILLAIVGAVFTHAMLEYPLHYAYFLIPIAFLVGLAENCTKKTFGVVAIHPLCISVVTLGSALLLTMVFNEYGIIERKTQSVRTDFRTYELRIDKGKTLDDLVLLTQLRELLKLAKKEKKSRIRKSDLMWLKQVSHRYPTPYTLGLYAKACLLNGHHEEVDRILALVRRIFDERYISITQSIVYGRSMK